MSTKPISMYCPYCHKHTSVTHARIKVWVGHSAYIGEGEWQADSGAVWWIGLCNFCHRPVLVRDDGQQIFPTPRPSPTDERMPSNIRSDLDEAKACMNVSAFRACAVMARRAIQSACIDKGAKKDKLVDQLNELATNVTITKDLLDWASLVRWVGNDAAHPDSKSVNKDDAEDILSLAEQFLHVLYVAPAMAKERREKRGKSQSSE